MRGVILTVAFAYLVIPPLMADPAPTHQTICQPANCLMPSAAARQRREAARGAAKNAAQLASNTPAKGSASTDASANVDSSHSESSVAQ
jgi:hypothetical protein